MLFSPKGRVGDPQISEPHHHRLPESVPYMYQPVGWAGVVCARRRATYIHLQQLTVPESKVVTGCRSLHRLYRGTPQPARQVSQAMIHSCSTHIRFGSTIVFLLAQGVAQVVLIRDSHVSLLKANI